MNWSRHVATRALLVLAFAVPGCVLAPRATREERLRAAAAARVYQPAFGDRQLPELAEAPGWREILARAFLANGELEAAYFEWRAALERIDVAAGYPNTNVSLGFEYLFSGGRLKGWDRSTLSVGFDPMQNLSFPSKVMAAGRVALADARVAGARFAAVKFDLQRRVLTAWHAYALLAERLRLQERTVELVRLAAAITPAELAAGARAAELLRAEAERARAEDALAMLAAELPQRRAELNALLARPAEAPLAPPAALPAPRWLPAEDTALLALGVGDNPEIAALGHEVEARTAAVERARQEFIPDFNPFAGFTGSLEQVAGVVISLPARVPLILGQIREARAMLRRAEAVARQTTWDRGAEFRATLVAVRDLERQAHLLDQRILPALEGAAANARAAYATGALAAGELIEAERLVLELRMLRAEVHTARETKLATLEALAGVDVETLAERGGTPS